MNIQVDPTSSNLASAVLNSKIRPRAVVGYGVKLFHPSPPNYVTRSPGWFEKNYFSCYHRRPMHNRRSSLLFFEGCSSHWLHYLCREKQSAWKRVWTYWFLLIGWKRVFIFASHKCIMASFYYQVQNAVNGLYCQANFSNFLSIRKTNLNKKAFWQSIRVLVVK